MARSSYAHFCIANFVLIVISYMVLDTRIKYAAEKNALSSFKRPSRQLKQETIVIYNRNVTSWTEKLPALYHGHVAFIDFTKFGLPNPIYINIVREPLERLLSHYYFLRYGDNFRVGLKRSKAGNNETFDQCWTRGGKDCDPKQLWLQIPYFCGTASYCSEVGNRQALEMAKWNAVNRYLLVGTSERMEDFIAVLEQLLPSFFRGALEHFRSLDAKRTRLRNTTKKITPADETVAQVKANAVYQMEREFYDFVRTEFEALWQRTHTDEGDFLPSQYHYEKIKP
ncbi:CBN-HST-2 protein [Aphelenchoides avenae]|nr:CBN-HST-2 protein [Aphelenchus avenae]